MKNTFAKRSVIASYLKLLHRHRGDREERTKPHRRRVCSPICYLKMNSLFIAASTPA